MLLYVRLLRMASLYLLHLNPQHTQVQIDLRDPYQMHRTLSRTLWRTTLSHARRSERIEKARILFRAEPESHRLWMISHLPPYFDRLLDGYLYGKPLSWAMDAFPILGDELAFRLRTRPQRRIGKLSFYVEKPTEALTWLHEKAESKGFEIIELGYTPISWFDSKDDANQHRSGMEFFGRLRVTDPLKFADAMLHGIGRDKAVGFGLLWVARLTPWGAPDLVALRERPRITWTERVRRARREPDLDG